MKKIIFLFVLLFYSTTSHADKIVYLDVQYIIDNSNLGVFYKNKIKIQQDKNVSELKIEENEIEKTEIEIKNKKNILSEEEINKYINELNELVKSYQLKRNEFNKNINESKKEYTSKILNILNPVLTNYVDKNEIIIVLDKKNILVGIKSLDITPAILKLLNDETEKKNLINEN